jgi:aspartate/methionine/tyrosine aminotransferase
MVSARLAPFGSTVFSTITARARVAGAVDLGQGYPSWEGPAFVKDAAVEAIREASNQYPPSMGLARLRSAVTGRWRLDTGAEIDPDSEVTITSGCTEALAATFIGLCEPGDGVILFEPAYDAYPVGCALAGAEPIYVTLHAPEFRFDETELRAAFARRPRVVVVNTPHNPTGRVFDDAEMSLIAELCAEHDVVAVTDEVYERISYDRDHLRLATFPGMWERTITLSSVGKSFSLTGWKTGWAIAPPHLTEAVRAAHQFLTFTTPNPMQLGTAAALATGDEYYRDLVDSYRAKRDVLVAGLADVGFGVSAPEGTYYVLADHTPFGFEDDRAFVDHLIDDVGVAAIPPSFFYHRSEEGKRLVRFAFCKDDAMLDSALARLGRLAS